MRPRHVGEHVVAALQPLDLGGQVVGDVLVEPVGQRGVEHLRARGVALAELLGGTHPLDQGCGDRLAGRVGGEGGEHVVVPGPLLEHLGGGLDEVPLGRHPGEPHQVLVTAQHVVDQVAELVEQGHHLVVLHQPPREVADQHPLGQLAPRHPGDQVELRGMGVLAGPGVQVEVDPAERASRFATGRTADHVVRRHVLVPARRVGHLHVGQVEQPAGDLEQTAAHPGEVEVAPDRLGVDVEPLATHHLAVEALVDPVHGLGVGPVDTDPVEQHAQVAVSGLGGQCGDLLDERRDGLPGADHLDLGVEAGPVGVARAAGRSPDARSAGRGARRRSPARPG